MISIGGITKLFTAIREKKMIVTDKPFYEQMIFMVRLNKFIHTTLELKIKTLVIILKHTCAIKQKLIWEVMTMVKGSKESKNPKSKNPNIKDEVNNHLYFKIKD